MKPKMGPDSPPRPPNWLHGWLYPELRLFPSRETRRQAERKIARRFVWAPQFWVRTIGITVGFIAFATWIGRLIDPPNRTAETFLFLGSWIGAIVISLTSIPFRKIRELLREQLRECGVCVCQRCGYDLRGNLSGICSECGCSIGTQKQSSPAPRIRSREELDPWKFVPETYERSKLIRAYRTALIEYDIPVRSKDFLVEVGLPPQELGGIDFWVSDLCRVSDHFSDSFPMEDRFREALCIARCSDGAYCILADGEVVFLSTNPASDGASRALYYSRNIESLAAQFALAVDLAKYSRKAWSPNRYHESKPYTGEFLKVAGTEILPAFIAEIRLIDEQAFKDEWTYWSRMVENYADFVYPCPHWQALLRPLERPAP